MIVNTKKSLICICISIVLLSLLLVLFVRYQKKETYPNTPEKLVAAFLQALAEWDEDKILLYADGQLPGAEKYYSIYFDNDPKCIQETKIVEREDDPEREGFITYWLYHPYYHLGIPFCLQVRERNGVWIIYDFPVTFKAE